MTPGRRLILIFLPAVLIVAAGRAGADAQVAFRGQPTQVADITAPAVGQAIGQGSLSATQAPAGAPVFRQNCSGCHGTDGGGTGIAPTLKAVNDPALVERIVKSGKGLMPSFASRLSGPQINAVAEYVAAGSTISLAGGTISRGGTLYRFDCGGCHGTTGRGGALVGAGLNAPALTGFAPAEVATAIIFGPGPMPSFSMAIVDQHDLASLVDYVGTLKEPDHPGGQPLGYRGPLTEALAGAAALAALVLVTVWIERKGRG